MDPVQKIIDALVLGAAAVGKDVASDAVRLAYNRLKKMFRRDSSLAPEGQAPVSGVKHPPLEPATLRKEVEDMDDQTRREVAAQAGKVLSLLKPSISQAAYSVNVQGSVGNLVQGSDATVTIIEKTRSRRKRSRNDS